jgi:probable F420-dependent oxidoreductase
MLIGYDLPTRGILAAAENIGRLAVEGEMLGYDFLTVSDHVIIPKSIDAKYPYSKTGEFPRGGRTKWFEQLTVTAWIAARTSRVKLVLSVMVVPHRPAVLTAKMLSTIDLLSNGRLVVGIGAGWMHEEFEALGTPPFKERGAVTDEYLAAFKELWTSNDPRFAGKHVRFSDVVMEPKPVQQPHPPIWVGGESDAALRRVARLCDGWYPLGTNPQHPLESLPRLQAGIEKMRRFVAEAGRDPKKIDIGYRVPRYGASLPAKNDQGDRRLFSGTPTDIAGDLKAMAELGVTAVDFAFGADTVPETIDNMKRFRDEVRSLL